MDIFVKKIKQNENLYMQETVRTSGRQRLFSVKTAVGRSSGSGYDNFYTPSADTVVLSHENMIIREAIEQIQLVPDVREEVVTDFKQKINAGTYNIEEDKIADRLLKEILVEAVI